jgi:integrase
MFFARSITVCEILKDYRDDFLLRQCRSIKALDSEVRMLNNHLGELPIAEVTTRRLRGYQSMRITDGVKPATVNKELANLSAALHLAASNELIDAIPKFPPRLPVGKPRQGFFEAEEYEAVRACLPGWAADVLDFGYYSGWRRSEVTGLTWSEIDLPGRRVRLDPDRSKNKETRVLPLMGFGLEVVERRVQARRSGLDLAFHRSGHPILSTSWWKTWRRATERAGLPHRLFHDLRRTCVRNLELAGVPRKVAMGWVGHRTESVYIRYHIVTEDDVLAAGHKLLKVMDVQATDRRSVVNFPAGLGKKT